MNKSILLLILVFIFLVIACVTAYYIYKLVVPYKEENILIENRKMKNNTISFNHNEIFTESCDIGVSYVFWCYIENWNYNYGLVKPILSKGFKFTERKGNTELLQENTSMPAIFLSNSTNTDGESDNGVPSILFTFRQSVTNEYNDVYELSNIPLNKWFHISVVIYTNAVELFMDGLLLQTIHFDGDLNFNESKLNIGELGGFDGNIAKLAILPYSISTSEVYRRFLSGPPSTTDTDDTCLDDSSAEKVENAPENNDVWGSIPYDLSEENTNPELTIDDTNVLEVFSQPNFNISGGSSAILSVGNYSVNDLAELGITPQSISGVNFLKEGYVLTLYANNEPTSTERKADFLILRDTSDWNGPLRRMNNKAKSLKIERDIYADQLNVKLYENKDYTGWRLRLPNGKYTETDLRLHGYNPENHIFKSYKINSTYQINLYKDDFFENQSNILKDSNTNAENMIGKISSLKIEPRSDEEIVACTFFEGKNFTGSSYKLSFGNYTMHDLIQKGITYEDINTMFILRSVIIPKGYNVLLYPKNEFQGIPQRLESTTSYIQGSLIHLSIIQSIKIVGANEPRFSMKKILDNLVSMIMNYNK